MNAFKLRIKNQNHITSFATWRLCVEKNWIPDQVGNDGSKYSIPGVAADRSYPESFATSHGFPDTTLWSF